jgi:hypothetical protein
MAIAPPTSADSLLCVEAHKHASRHRVEIEASSRCACFFCFRTFPSASIDRKSVV